MARFQGYYPMEPPQRAGYPTNPPQRGFVLPQDGPPLQTQWNGECAGQSAYAVSSFAGAVPGMPAAVPLGALPQNLWMPAPVRMQGCPPGLEYLTEIDQILVDQGIDVVGILTDWETENKYAIKNSMGQNIYAAVEDSECCNRQCFQEYREFEMRIYDNMKNEVIRLFRPICSDVGPVPGCLQGMTVSSPPGTVIGHIEQVCDLLLPKFKVRNEFGQCTLKIEGPCLTCNVFGDVDFRVLTRDDFQIGKIAKQWGGLAREYFTTSTKFGVTFPMDLDVKAKAGLLGALFLIDYMYYERNLFRNLCLGY